jgi:hypothetical protein
MSFVSDVIVTIANSADTVNIDPSQANTVEIAPAPTPSAPQAVPPASGPSQAWLRAAGKPETSAPLLQLPAGLSLAAADEPIHFDEARKLLLYRGFMCHGSYLYLRHLSEDLAYLAALDQLYVQSASGDSARRGTGVLVASLAAVAAGLSLALWCFLR